MHATTEQTSAELNLDLSGRILSISPQIERAIGYHDAELVGQPFESLVPFDDLPALRQRIRLTLSGEVTTHSLRLLGRYGDIRELRACSRPLFRDGRAVGLRSLILDLTPSEN
jgi:PAS domain S-box-containing protein